jgi:amino acid permease
MAESTEMEIVAQSLPTEDPSKVTERVSISAAENSIPDVEPVTTDLE